MTNTITAWLLGGALAASLAWNFRTRPAPASDGCSSCSASAMDCSAAIEALDLDPVQRGALERWSSTACKKSAQCDSLAGELAREMFTLLSARDVDPERARSLADEIGRLRAQSLRECVDSMLEVRRVLSPEQVDQLLGRCCKTQDR
jgi:Spy/CpxP family protein refolding chaperone